MKWLKPIILIILISTIACAANYGGIMVNWISEASSVTSDLQGRIQSDNGPVEGAVVELYATNDHSTPVASVQTDEQGNFSFFGTSSGSYHVYAREQSYTSAWYGNEAQSPQTVILPTASFLSLTLNYQAWANWLENFSDGDDQNLWSGYWYDFADNTSAISRTMITDNSVDHNEALYFDYTLGSSGLYPYAAVGTNFSPRDLSDYTAIRFDCRGDSVTLQVILKSAIVTDYDDFAQPFTVSGQWTTVTLPLNDFSQAGWGQSKQLSQVLQSIEAIHIQTASQRPGEQGTVVVDNLRFISSDVTAPDIVSVALTPETLYEGVVTLSVSLNDTSGIDTTKLPTITAVFQDDSTRTATVNSLSNTELTAVLRVNASDAVGTIQLSLSGLYDTQGNEQSAVLGSVEKVDRVDPELGTVAVNSEIIGQSGLFVLTVNFNTGDYPLATPDNGLLVMNLEDGQRVSVDPTDCNDNRIVWTYQFTQFEGRVTLDVLSVRNSLGVEKDFFNIASITVDLTDPVIEWNAVDTTVLQRYPLSVTVNEDVAVTLYVNHTYVLTQDIAQGNHIFTVSLNEGINDLEIYASDQAMNTVYASHQTELVEQDLTVSSSATSDVRLRLPAGAINFEAGLSVNIISLDSGLLSQQGPIYDIRLISATGNTISNIQFEYPVILELPYDGTITDQVYVRYLDESVYPNVWRRAGVRVISVDTVAHRVVAEILHLTRFSVFSYQDVSEPQIQSVKLNGVALTNNAVIPQQPQFEITLSDEQTNDSGLMTYTLSMEDTNGTTIDQVSGNLNDVARTTLGWTPTQTLQAGSYQLNITAVDNTDRSSTDNITLIVYSTLSVGEFLAGPNPVNIIQDSIHFTYSLSQDADVTLSVFDTMGRRVKQFSYASGVSYGAAGSHDLSWDGQSDSGGLITTGLYIAHLKVKDGTSIVTKRFLILVTK